MASLFTLLWLTTTVTFSAGVGLSHSKEVSSSTRKKTTPRNTQSSKKRSKKRRKKCRRKCRKNTVARRHYTGTKALNSFINQAVRKHKFNRKKLTSLFAHIKSRPDIVKLMNRQAEDFPWYRYKKIFLGKKRINDGVKFWKKNTALLNRAYKKYGVPPEIVIAIIGVETLYGQRKGNIAILESLATLSFDFPRRSKFFRSEMMHFLRMAREEKLNPAKLRGSYAGAMGMPQFMPSSYRAYAIDFDKDGKRDLFNSRADAIGSVAHYFSTFGWKRGRPIVTRAKITGKKYRKIPKPKRRLKPHLTLKQYAAYGVKPRSRSKAYKSSYKASFVRLRVSKTKREYWLGMGNFYTITRYNHSTHYAMAVYLLSEKIKSKYKAGGKKRITLAKISANQSSKNTDNKSVKSPTKNQAKGKSKNIITPPEEIEE